jgi:hypothetical protein
LCQALGAPLSADGKCVGQKPVKGKFRVCPENEIHPFRLRESCDLQETSVSPVKSASGKLDGKPVALV